MRPGGLGGKALRLLRDRPTAFPRHLRAYALFLGTGLLRRLLGPDPDLVRLGRNVRLQRLRCVDAEAPDARIVIGDHSIVYERAEVGAYGSGRVEIGPCSVLGDVRIACRHRVSIGSRFLGSWNVLIQDYDPHPTDPGERRRHVEALCARFRPRFAEVPFPEAGPRGFPGSPVVIGDDVWAGANSAILKGARIGCGSIVAAGAVVLSGSYPRRSLLAGNPARVVRLLALLAALLLPRAPASAAVTAVWANTGEDKVAREELRAADRAISRGSAASKGGGAASARRTTGRTWDGRSVRLYGARNEVVSFNLVLEAKDGARDVAVSFDSLTGPDGAAIGSRQASGDGVFDWRERDIELFHVRYLRIRGLSLIANPVYDERLVPRRLRRPWGLEEGSGRAVGRGLWTDRPDHDKDYPEIAVPMELVPCFDIPPRSSQSVWADVYIPKGSPAGDYRGLVRVRAGGAVVRRIPVRLTVWDFTLPDVPAAKTMLFYSSPEINRRFLGKAYPDLGTPAAAKASLLRDRYFMLAHRHRVSLIGDSPGSDCADLGDQPCPDWLPRLDGSLFTAARGYAGPGEGVGNGVYSIGTYGSWSWRKGTEADMRSHADRWVRWFEAHAPSTEYFLYLIDESSDYPAIERWARWLAGNPGPGRALRSLATVPLPQAARRAPHLDIPVSTIGHGVASEWQPLADRYTAGPRRRLYMYNGHRPGSGSFATEDDGVALRELAWGQYKKRIDRWFYWQSTYYYDYQGWGRETDVFAKAQTFGGWAKVRSPNLLGRTADGYGNGDGVLFYPGTDAVYPRRSYGVEGPFASLRLKHWRRGIQDVDYLALAAARDEGAVRRLVERMVPKALWEYGVHDPKDPTYQYADVSWPTDPEAWEAARAELAAIILGLHSDDTAPVQLKPRQRS